MRIFPIPILVLCFAACWGCGGETLVNEPEVPTAPSTAEPEPPPPETGETFLVQFETSEGDFVVEVHPEWAPHGAARFRELVEAGFYDDVRFFRVVEGFMAQFGMSGDPETNARWQDDTIPDDPVVQSNTEGMVTFATSGPDSRTTQLFINYADNSSLDAQGFAPIGRVIEGMDVVRSLYSGYGDGPPFGRGPSQGRIAEEGNAYLEEDFPELDYIITARIMDEEADETAASESPEE